MKLLATYMILALTIPQNAFAAQFADTVMDATFKLFNSASTSTCFFVRNSKPDASLYLVTTAHTLERMNGETAIVVLRRRDDNGLYKRVDHEIVIRKGTRIKWRRHEKHDVAVLAVDDSLPVPVTAIGIDRLADAERFAAEGVGICDRLFVFTYPERFESSRAGHPIARQGIFSSPPLLAPKSSPTFLADFTTFPGDSGGPAFIHGKDGKPLVVGVVVGQQHHDERIDSVYESRVVKHPFRLGLVLHAHHIRETLRTAANSPQVTKETTESLRISLAADDWGDAQKADILNVLNSAALPLWVSAGKPELRPVTVFNDSKGPLVAFDRGEADTYKVLLNVKGRLWARFAFQFSHEMCHVLGNYRDVPNRQMWLEEALCECASLYSLRAMGESWKSKPPYPNWKSYAASLTQYADDRIAGAPVVSSDNLQEWYEQNKDTLDATATNRELNLVVAVRMLKIFERHPQAWRVVRSLNLGSSSENSTLEQYLSGWHERAEMEQKPIVEDIASLFRISLSPR